MFITVKGHIANDGTITIESGETLPTGDVEITIAYQSDAERADEAIWDAKFAATPISVFERLIAEAQSAYDRGETEPFDPDHPDD